MAQPVSDEPIACILLCGGRGTRMGSTTVPKVCFPVGGEPAVCRVIRAFRDRGVTTVVVVVGTLAGQVVETVGQEFPGVVFAFQRDALGTGHAARVGFVPLQQIGFTGPVLIAAGDKVIEPAVIEELKREFYRTKADLAFVVGRKTDPGRMGRVAIEPDGRVLGIFEYRDLRRARVYQELTRLGAKGRPVPARRLRDLCRRHLPSDHDIERAVGALWRDLQADRDLSPEDIARLVPDGADALYVGPQAHAPDRIERLGRFVNESVYMFRPSTLSDGFERLARAPQGKEEYVTDLVNLLARERTADGAPAYRIRAVEAAGSDAVMGFNTPSELLAIEGRLAERPTPAPRRTAPKLSRAILKPVRQWLARFDRMAPDLRATLRHIYGTDPKLIDQRCRAYRRALERFRRRYGDDTPAIVVRAPGSINLMGRHIDNQGGCINVMTIDKEVVMVASARPDDVVELTGADAHAGRAQRFSISNEVAQMDWDEWLSYPTAERTRQIVQDARGDWARYVRAVVLRLQQSFKHVPLHGMNAVVTSNIPAGAGMSHASAMLLAGMEAAAALNRLAVQPAEFIDFCGETDWYVGSGQALGDHAAVKFGRRGSVATIRFFPLEVETNVQFPASWRIVVAHAGAEPSADVVELRRRHLAGFQLGLLLAKDLFPQYAHLFDHLRDLSAGRLGIRPSQWYGLLQAFPLRISPRDLRRRLSSAWADQADAWLASHSPVDAYALRDLVLFGLAECARGEVYAASLRRGDPRAIGALMQASHDAERVVWHSAPDQARPFEWSATDERIQSLIADLQSEDPGRVERAQTHRQPGRYGGSTPEIDRMVDLATGVDGVIGAQLSGAGLGGRIMVVVEDHAVGALKRRLAREFYRPAQRRPEISVCTPIEGAGLLKLGRG